MPVKIVEAVQTLESDYFLNVFFVFKKKNLARMRSGVNATISVLCLSYNFVRDVCNVHVNEYLNSIVMFREPTRLHA